MIRSRAKVRLSEVKKTTIICVGIAPAPGCGAVLSSVERRQHAEICEYCELDYQERLRAWRFGEFDPELEELLGPVG